MINQQAIHRQIVQLFAEQFQIEIPSTDTDIIAEGLLDSMVFVDLIMHLESMFELSIAIEDLELDEFRTVERMAEFLMASQAKGSTSGSRRL